MSGGRSADRAEIVRERFERQLRQQLLDLVDDALVAEHAARPLGPHSDRLARVLNYIRRAPVEGKYIVVAVERDRAWQIGRISRRDPASPVVLEPETYSDYHEALHAVFLRRLAELRAPGGSAEPARATPAGERTAIFGYTSNFSFEPGERVPVHVSCEHVAEYAAQLVRLRHGFDGAEGPGFREEELASASNRTYPGRYRPPHTGSYVVVSDARGQLERLASWTIELLVQPTTPEKPLQGLLGSWAQDRAAGYALVLIDGRLGLLLGDGSGEQETLVLDLPLERGCWYRARAALDTKRSEAFLNLEPVHRAVNSPLLAPASRARGGEERFRTRLLPVPSGAPFLLAALGRSAGGELEPSAHYNGKLEEPSVFADAALGGDTPRTLLARWDFGSHLWSDRGGRRRSAPSHCSYPPVPTLPTPMTACRLTPMARNCWPGTRLWSPPMISSFSAITTSAARAMSCTAMARALSTARAGTRSSTCAHATAAGSLLSRCGSSRPTSASSTGSRPKGTSST